MSHPGAAGGELADEAREPAVAAAPRIERVRHEPRRRRLRVARSERVTPGLLRLTLEGDDLTDFASAGFDDHVKVFVPGGDDRRDYTPRRFDREAGALAIDFALHPGGVVIDWALAARPGDLAEVGGPKGSTIVSTDVRRWLLVGDETALPAIGRRVEEAPAGTRITSVVAVAGPDERQAWRTAADHAALWAHRPAAAADHSRPLVDLLDGCELPPGTFVWIAAEAGVARALRDAVAARGHPRGWTRAGGLLDHGTRRRQGASRLISAGVAVTPGLTSRASSLGLVDGRGRGERGRSASGGMTWGATPARVPRRPVGRGAATDA